ncbi:MAG: G5 domain-containing protein [Clostridia bacterium]|nr:G5 domain-containing protein [Clostridia bacterium]
MKKYDKASISMKKLILMSVALLFTMGVGVLAFGAKLNNVKIIYADGYEVNVMTSKTKISEILDENHIILLPDEVALSENGEEISDNKTIRIVKNGSDSSDSKNSEDEEQIKDELNNYETVTEKIVKEEVSIAYETETKDYSTGDGEKVEKITQNGVEGVKEILYKIKIVEGNEEEKIQIAENIVEEPVDCIKEIRNKEVPVVTSRNSSSIESEEDESIEEDSEWSGKKLSKSSGVVSASQTPSGYKETYYNLNMSGCLKAMGLSSDGYSVRSDGVKTYNGYVMVASPNLSKYPKGSYIRTTLGMGYVVDYCPSGNLDIAVTW